MHRHWSDAFDGALGTRFLEVTRCQGNPCAVRVPSILGLSGSRWESPPLPELGNIGDAFRNHMQSFFNNGSSHQHAPNLSLPPTDRIVRPCKEGSETVHC